MKLSRGVFCILSNIWDRACCENCWCSSAFDNFCKNKLALLYSIQRSIHAWMLFLKIKKASFLVNFWDFFDPPDLSRLFFSKTEKKLYEKNQKETGDGFWEISLRSLLGRVGIIYYFALTKLDTVCDLGKLRFSAVDSFLY